MALCQHDWPGNVRELANMVERLAIIHAFGVVDLKDLPDKFHQYTNAPSHLQQELTLEADLFEEPKVSMAVAPSSSYNKLSSGILPEQGMDLKEHLNDLEYSLIQQALDDSEGVVAHAAKNSICDVQPW